MYDHIHVWSLNHKSKSNPIPKYKTVTFHIFFFKSFPDWINSVLFFWFKITIIVTPVFFNKSTVSCFLTILSCFQKPFSWKINIMLPFYSWLYFWKLLPKLMFTCLRFFVKFIVDSLLNNFLSLSLLISSLLLLCLKYLCLKYFLIFQYFAQLYHLWFYTKKENWKKWLLSFFDHFFTIIFFNVVWWK